MATSGRPWAHPLDPITADEVRQVATVLRRDRGVEPPRWRFASIELVEPPKKELREFDEARAVGNAGRWPRREAQAVCWNRADGRAYQAVISLTQGVIEAKGPGVTATVWR